MDVEEKGDGGPLTLLQTRKRVFVFEERSRGIALRDKRGANICTGKNAKWMT